MLSRAANAMKAAVRRASAWAYDATEPRGRRKSAPQRLGSEDKLLDSERRKKLIGNARDLHRNFSIAAWMVRKHLDYVASFSFHCRSGNVDLDEQVEDFMAEWSLPYNFDAAGRHRLSRMLRLLEARRTLDGDAGLLKLASGQVQAIEGDRIRNPQGRTTLPEGDTEWIHGVRCNRAGRALAYAIHRRTGVDSYELERIVAARHLHLLGYFDRIDQVRGVSPIASALNPLRDVYENFDYALAKAKISQLFAMAIYSEAQAGLGNHMPFEGQDEDEDGEPKYEVNFERGPFKLELDPGDKAEFLESQTPSDQFQNFTMSVIGVGLKALDIPLSFFDEAHTNFFGSRAAWLHYEQSAKSKREDNLELLNRITAWRLSLAVLDGRIVLPRGWTLRDVPWEWVPAGMPWWDPAKEIRGDLMAIGAGLDNPQRITKERGRGDWYDNIDRIAEAMEYAKAKGVPLSFVVPPEPAAAAAEGGEEGSR